MAFDIKKAREDGYSDNEIADYLASQNSGFDVKKAYSDGYSLDEIASEISRPQTQQKSLADIASSTTKNIALSPFGIPLGATARTAMAAQAADKRYPTQNLLPMAGMMVGSTMGGIPGAGLGAAAGEAGRQLVSRARGQDAPQTPLDSGVKIGVAGVEGAALEGAGRLAFRALEGLGAFKIAKKGMNSLKGYLGDVFKPTDKAAVSKTFDSLKDIPKSTEANRTQDIIGEFLGDRGLSYKPSANAIRRRMFQDADLSPKELVQMSEDLARAKTPKVVSDLNTPDVSKYQTLGDVLDDLSKKDLTYGQMAQMQKEIGDMANFGAAERTPIEKLYGAIYRAMGDDMSATAKSADMLSQHEFVYKNLRKAHQEKLLSRLFEKSREFTPYGENVDYGKLATKLNNYSDNQLETLFGGNAKEIKALRDITNHNARIFGQPIVSEPRGTTHFNVWASIHPMNLWRRMHYPEAIGAIGARRGVPGLKDIVTPPGVLKPSIRGVMSAPFLEQPFNEE